VTVAVVWCAFELQSYCASDPFLSHLQRVGELFRGWWPLAGVNASFCIGNFREADHMKLTRKPGQPLGDAVRDLMLERTGVRPSGRILLLTHLAYFGYCFNPVSFYFVYSGSIVEAVIAEVSNTPWGEMHYYVMHPNCRDVVCSQLRLPSSWRNAVGAAPDASSVAALRVVGVETAAHAATLDARGAVSPLDFETLAGLFAAPAAAGAPAGSSLDRARSLSCTGDDARRLRFDFSKNFHVSPFLPMDHTYSWVFTAPDETLLVQSQNRASDGVAVFHTQLRLTRQPALTWQGMAYLLLVAFPLLTYRIQWFIHVEAFRLWLKGAQLYGHPHGSTNTFTRVVEALFTPIAALFWLAGRVRLLFSAARNSA
jgi:DUF1365 family protein